MIKRSVRGDDAALCQITLTTCQMLNIANAPALFTLGPTCTPPV